MTDEKMESLRERMNDLLASVPVDRELLLQVSQELDECILEYQCLNYTTV